MQLDWNIIQWIPYKLSVPMIYVLRKNLIMLHYCTNGLACWADRVFFTLANSEKKITSPDPSDLLSFNVVVQLSSCSIIVSFLNPQVLVTQLASIKQFKIQNLSFWSYNCWIGGRRITYQDLESKFWLAKRTITLPYWQTLFFSPSCTAGYKVIGWNWHSIASNYFKLNDI